MNLEELARFSESMAGHAESIGRHDWAKMHHACAAACRELAKRHDLPKYKMNAVCWQPSMSGLPHDPEVAAIVAARQATDAALAECGEERSH